MLTVPSIPPLLLEAHEHDTHFTPADHGGQTTLRLCNVLVLSCVHPCERFLKAPLGTTDAHWSPKCCLCLSDRRELDRGKSTLCHMFTKDLRSLKTGSYSFFAKDLDLFVFSSIANFSENRMAAHSPSHLWPNLSWLKGAWLTLRPLDLMRCSSWFIPIL